MTGIKQVLQQKVKNFNDALLMAMLGKYPLHDWRAWGDNELRIFAEEAYSRGLID